MYHINTKAKARAKAKKTFNPKIQIEYLTSDDEEILTLSLPIPVNTEGCWVKRKDFVKEKSFGYFVCKECKKSWLSAHSFKKYKQGCKGCEIEYYPKYLWNNTEKRKESPEFEKVNKDKPHDRTRCEACHLGICLDRLTI